MPRDYADPAVPPTYYRVVPSKTHRDRFDVWLFPPVGFPAPLASFVGEHARADSNAYAASKNRGE